MTLQQAVQFLLENKYLTVRKGIYSLTIKFHQDIFNLKEQEKTQLQTGKESTEGELLPTLTTGGNIASQAPNWEDLYLNFIKEADVPPRCESRNGAYDTNKYSVDGMKVFRKMIEQEKVNYPVLVASTKLYYKTHKSYALKIGNYIAEGGWRSDYDALINSAQEGTLHEHIEQEIKRDERYTGYDLG